MNDFVVVVLAIELAVLFSTIFSFWKDLKEDYPADLIFSLYLLILFTSFFFGRLAYVIGPDLITSQGLWSWLDLISQPGISLPIAYLSGFLIFYWFTGKNKWNSWQIGDSVIFQFFKIIFFFSLAGQLINFSWYGVSLTVLAGIVYLLGRKLAKIYRSIRWYKSGKVGFLATSLTFAFFSLFLLLDIFLGKALYWERLFNLGLAVLGLVLLYIRSGRNFRQDFKIFNKNGQN